MKNAHYNHKSSDLRQKAENLIKMKASKKHSQLSESEALKLIHELEVHQIELELQNEELVFAKAAMQEIQEKYVDLYDFAPSGYFTLTNLGEILELNFNGAKMLGKSRSQLKNAQFNFFLSQKSKQVFSQFLDNIFSSKVKNTCEVTITNNGSSPIFVLLEGIITDNEKQCVIAALNITERTLAENKLSELSIYRDTILAAVPNIIMQVDNNKVYTFANNAGNEFFGHDVIGKEASYYFEGEQDTYPIVTPLFEGNKDNIYVESWQRRKDGEKRLLAWNCLVLKDPKGHVTGVLSSAIDITEEREVQVLLKESEQKYSSLFNSMSEGVALHEMVYDKKHKAIDYRILETNPMFEKHTGLSTKNVKNRLASEFYGTKEAPYLEIYSMVAETGRPHYFESYFSLLDKHFDISVFSPKKGMFATIFTDISERKKSEEKLQKSEERFRIIASNTPDHIIIQDKDLIYTTVINPQLGLTEKEMIGKTDFDFLKKEDAENLTAFKRKVLETGESIHIETSLKNKKNKPEFFNGTFVPQFNLEGKVNGLIGYFRNVTERKQAEEELQKSRTELVEYFENDISADYVVSVKGRIINCNKTFLELFGFKDRSEAEKISLPRLYKNRKDGVKIIELITKNKKVENYEIDFVSRTGKVINTIINAIGIFNEAGELIKVRGYVVDISDRKQVEIALKENKELFALFMHHSPIYTFIKEVTSTESRVIQASDNFSEMIGLSGTKMAGKTMDELFPAEFAAKISADDWTVVKKGKILQLDEDLNGRYYTTIKFPIIQGEKKLLAGYTIDITERKLAEEKIHEKDIQFRKLSANVPDLIFQFTRKPDGSYCVPIASDGIRNIFGCSPEDVLDDFTPIANVIYPEDAARVLSDIENSAEHLTYFTCEFRVQIPGKPIQWIYSKSTPEKLEDGSVTWYGFNVDITEHKRAEEEILILAHSLKSVNECVSITDFENKMIFLNDSFVKTYGYNDAEELTGKKMDVVGSPRNPPDIIEKIYSATVEGGWQGELINTKKDGTEFPIFLSTTVIKDKSDKPIGLIGVASDITDRRKKEKELIRAKEKAEESDRLKSAFLANMSHEIRTPMNGILGFAELLKEPRLTGQEQQKYIHIIEKSGERMLSIINDIINISKVESGQMELLITETNINEQIEDIFTFFQPELEKKGVQFYFKNSLPTKKAIVKTDREKVYAILTNLVKNAIKFTKTGFIEFGYEKKGLNLEFFVKDSGAGIPGKNKEIIFERFRQGNDLLNKGYEGSGLGLTISKAYVEMLGGKIWVESEEGAGAIFYFTIPYLIKDENIGTGKHLNPGDDQKNQANQKISGLKILIVDDDESSDLLITRIVKDISSEIFKAKNGIEAIDFCRNIPNIDLILMDVKMPIMDGYEATRRIRQFNKKVIIIAQTAYALAGEREDSLNAGCTDYISKPINRVLLLELIQRHFND